MNWSGVILVGTVAITALWWTVHAAKNYPGPKVLALYVKTEGVAPATTEKGSVAATTREVETEESSDPNK